MVLPTLASKWIQPYRNLNRILDMNGLGRRAAAGYAYVSTINYNSRVI